MGPSRHQTPGLAEPKRGLRRRGRARAPPRAPDGIWGGGKGRGHPGAPQPPSRGALPAPARCPPRPPALPEKHSDTLPALPSASPPLSHPLTSIPLTVLSSNLHPPRLGDEERGVPLRLSRRAARRLRGSARRGPSPLPLAPLPPIKAAPQPGPERRRRQIPTAPAGRSHLAVRARGGGPEGAVRGWGGP